MTSQLSALAGGLSLKKQSRTTSLYCSSNSDRSDTPLDKDWGISPGLRSRQPSVDSKKLVISATHQQANMEWGTPKKLFRE